MKSLCYTATIVIFVFLLPFMFGCKGGRSPDVSISTAAPDSSVASESTESQPRIGAGQTGVKGTPTPGTEERMALARARLERGRAHHADGDYDLAIDELVDVPALAPGTPEAGEALFLLGQSYLARERFKEAEEVLRKFESAYWGDERSRRARFFMAMALRGLGRVSEAYDAYESYVAGELSLSDHVMFAIAEMYAEAGRDDLAETFFFSVIGNETSSLRGQAMEKLADVYWRSERFSDAVRLYEAALNRAGASDEARLRFLLGRAYGKAGNLAGAKAQFDAVVRRFPLSGDSTIALEALSALGEEISAYLKGRVSFFQWDLKGALDLLQLYIRINPDGEYAPLAHYYLARTYWRQDDEPRALEHFANVAERFPRSEVAAESRWLRGRILEDQGRLDEAAAEYLRLATDYPRGEYWSEALFRRGLAGYKKGDLNGAAQLWLSYLDDGAIAWGLPREAQAKLLLWAGKARSKLGREEEASQLWRRAAQLAPEDYYGLRADDILAGSPPGLKGTEAAVLPWKETEEQRTELAQWLSSQAASAGAGNESITPETDAGVQRARRLLGIGRRDEAAAEIRAAIDRFSRQPEALYQLALLAQEQRMHHLAISAGWLLQRLANQSSVSGLPVLAQRLLYPVPYDALVLQRAEQEGLDPYLLLALMRQESMFNRDAHSTAGASGLTQVIPSTGAEIAEKLGRDAFKPRDLLQPSVSITFGAWYLARQLENFEGNYFFALAAYNGGAGNVWDWNGGDLKYDKDLFVEDILFGETRSYVKLVYSNYRQYQRLYAR